jgi:uncharacterized lipoprotein YajG
MLVRVLTIAGLFLFAGCAGKSTSSRAEHPSARAQDSAIARSNLPGAKGVGAAMRVSDSADARRRREDSVSNAVP